jgi:hydroxymethylglutaryl-CoA reductase
LQPITGFSKLSKVEKIEFLNKELFNNSKAIPARFESYWHTSETEQKIFDEFSENTLTNYFFPYGVVPNFLLDDELICVPMVIEESSVVAACAKSAKFWQTRGGFKSQVISTSKVGQVHFSWEGNPTALREVFDREKANLLNSIKPLLASMQKRGGGLKTLELIDRTSDEPDYYQLFVTFETCDAMGANFINSVLEGLATELQKRIENVKIIMSILSNYTPDCLAKAWVECPVEQLNDPSLDMSPEEFIEKFTKAVRISQIDVHRATTHNKGIFNGVDSVILATGNDFRAVEACGHTFAAKDGHYRGLTKAEVVDGMFKFSIELPLSLGTVGGLTSLHPLAKLSLDMLGQPDAARLMTIAAAAGLAQNFAALRSLVTSGIQKGHMKMHLMNILNHLEANESEANVIKKLFENKTISHQGIRDELSKLRNYQ